MRFLQMSNHKIFFALAFTYYGLFSACSKESESSEQNTANAAPPAEEIVSEKPAVSLTPGIPEICSLTEKDNATCIRCVPRDIPILKCANKKLPTLVAVENCSYDDKLVACTHLESEFDLRLNYMSQSLKEKYYVNLEDVVGGIKFIVGATLKEETENDRVLFFSIFDTVVKNKKDVFLGQNTEKIVDELMVAFVAKDPTLPEDRRAKVRLNVKKAVELLDDDIDETAKGSAGVILFLNNIVEAMKVGNEGSDFASVKVAKLVETLNSPKNRDLIDELLNSYIAQ